MCVTWFSALPLAADAPKVFWNRTNEAPLSRLDVAAQRFNDALSALEERTKGLRGLSDEAADAQAEIAEMAAERERRLARIAEVEEENRALAATTEEVETRLDSAIG